MPMPSEIDRAWAAGFFDGEGSTSLKRSRSGEAASFIRLYISQAREQSDLVERFGKIMGVGVVKPRRDRPGVTQWTVQDSAGVTRALQVMWPYLGRYKKEQAERCGYVSA